MRTGYLKSVAFLSILLFLASCARNPVTGKKEVMLMSQSQEQALGDQSDPSIVAAYGLYEDAELQSFINKKGQEMAKVSHRPDLTYNFKILDSPVVNAFALPGGYVYFTRGIMAHFNNEAEFAGVLGHEIGHITARHSAKQYTKQMIGQVGFMAGVIASEKFRQFANEAQQGLGLMFLKFGRDAESESDKLGAEYSTKIGYDAHQMAEFFNTLDRLQQQAGVTIPDFLSTHPNPVDRHAKVHEHADDWQAQVQGPKKVNRDSYLRMIDGMIFGEDPKQGYVENNIFYHPVLLFQFPKPADWQLQNAPTMVQMAPQDGKAMMQFTISSEASLTAAKSKLIEDAQLTVVEQKNTTIGGFNALAMISEQVLQQQGQTQQAGQAQEVLKVISYFIQYGEFVYMFHGMAMKADFNQYLASFKGVATKFKKLTDQSKINKKPTRIKIAKVNQGGTLQSVLQSFGQSQEQFAEIAIVNGMTLSDRVEAGQSIKLFVEK